VETAASEHIDSCRLPESQSQPTLKFATYHQLSSAVPSSFACHFPLTLLSAMTHPRVRHAACDCVPRC
jgi:hypothetical protein